MPEYYTLNEISEHFRISKRTLYRWISEGKHFDLKVLKKLPCGKYLVPRHEIDRISASFDL